MVTVNQRQNGGQWRLLGQFAFEPGAGHKVVLTAAADGAVAADAIRLVAAAPAPGNLVYIHADHLATPQKMTDAAQALVWDRVQEPFGRTASLTASPGIDSSLRFPGQQFDPESALHYNYFRVPRRSEWNWRRVESGNQALHADRIAAWRAVGWSRRMYSRSGLA